MALLDEVKRELSEIDGEMVLAQKAQVTSMLRFGGGLRKSDRNIIVQAQFDSLDAAQWLQRAIKNLYGHDAMAGPGGPAPPPPPRGGAAGVGGRR
ncbi:MAG: hypothetical protein K2I40_01290, partial [Bifidobacterium castoris]|nr:hypothetical protein [Bifidobacterium castoris]